MGFPRQFRRTPPGGALAPRARRNPHDAARALAAAPASNSDDDAAHSGGSEARSRSRARAALLRAHGPFLLCGCLVAVSCSKSQAPATETGAMGVVGPDGTLIAAGNGARVGARGTAGAPGIGVGVGAAGNGSFPAGAAGGFAAGTGAIGMVPTTGAGPTSVLQYHANAHRDGLYVDPAFTRAAAAMIKREPAFMAPIKGPTYAQPLYFDSQGGTDLIVTATEQNEVSAFDAMTGLPVWQKVLAPPGEPGCGGSIRPLGITGTPVIDAAARRLYVAALTMGNKHMIYALSLVDGALIEGWPVDVSTVKAGAVAFNGETQNQRGALLLLNNTLYVPYGGHFQDCGEFHGWVVGVPLNNPAAPFAFATKGVGGGIWAPGGLATDGTSIFAATGNTMAKAGASNTTPSTWSHGNAVLRLAPDLKDIAEAQTIDFFADENWKKHDMEGWDLGSSAPVLFNMPGSTPASLALAMGKSGEAFLLDAAKLGGMGGELQTLSVTEGSLAGGMIQAAAVYPTPTGTFAAFRSTQVPMMMKCPSGSGNYGAIKITAGSPPKMALAWCAEGNGTGSPIVTSPDGMTDSVVWYVTGGKLYGIDGETGKTLFRGTESVGYVDKYQTPIVAKGRLFVAATDAVYSFTVK